MGNINMKYEEKELKNAIQKELSYINFGLIFLLIFLLIILFFGIFVKVDTYVIAEGFVSFNNSRANISYKEWGTLE